MRPNKRQQKCIFGVFFNGIEDKKTIIKNKNAIFSTKSKGGIDMNETIKDRLLQVAFANNYGSLRQLAEACGVNYANLVRVANGKKGERTLMKIANFFKVSFEWLTTGCGMCGLEGNETLDALGDEFEQRREAPSQDIRQDMTPESESAPTLKEVLQFLSAGGLDAEGRISYKGLKNLMALQKELELKDEMLRQKDDEIAFLRQLLSQK